MRVFLLSIAEFFYNVDRISPVLQGISIKMELVDPLILAGPYVRLCSVHEIILTKLLLKDYHK